MCVCTCTLLLFVDPFGIPATASRTCCSSSSLRDLHTCIHTSPPSPLSCVRYIFMHKPLSQFLGDFLDNRFRHLQLIQTVWCLVLHILNHFFTFLFEILHQIKWNFPPWPLFRSFLIIDERQVDSGCIWIRVLWTCEQNINLASFKTTVSGSTKESHGILAMFVDHRNCSF